MKTSKLSKYATVELSNVDKKITEGEQMVKLCNFVDVYYNWAVTKVKSIGFMPATASENEKDKFLLNKGDVLLTKDSETRVDIGIPCYVADDLDNVVLGYHCALIRIFSDELSPKYLNALLHTEYARTYFAYNASGSGQRYTLGKEAIEDFPIPYLPKEEQDKIGDFLSNIDRKIEVNRKTIAHLEIMAKQLYDYWFVQFDFPNAEGKPYKSSGGKMVWNEKLKREIPEGWEDGKLEDLANITMGQSPEGSTYNSNGEGTLFYQGSTDFGFRYPDVRQYTTSPTRFAEEGDILMSVRAPVGTMNIANADCCIGRGLCAISPKKGCTTHLYYVLNIFKQRFDQMNNGGTTFGCIGRDEIHALPILLPSDELLEKYAAFSKPIFDKQMGLGKEISRLSSLRDFLLPMLMNGQVTLKA